MAKRRRTVKRSSEVEHPSGLTIRGADLRRAQPAEWAWEERVLMGYLNLLVGEEGIGKGNLAAWIIARLTRGELPGDLLHTAREVLLVGDEDSWDHIWVPRLEAAGADRTRAKYLASGPGGTLDVRKDADALRDYVKEEGVALVYFDQLLDNLGVADTWKDKDVRDALAPLRAVARETNSAMLAAMHPNKRGGSFRERISGTPAFNALSRSSLLVAAHPDEPGRVVVVRGKGNYGVEPDAFEFRIEEHVLKLEKPRRQIKTSRIASFRETGLRRDDLLDAARDRRRDDSQAGQARAMLAEMFSNGEKRPAREVLGHLFEVHGIPERVVQRARDDLGLDTWQEGYQGPWFWGQSRPKRKVKRSPKRGTGQ